MNIFGIFSGNQPTKENQSSLEQTTQLPVLEEVVEPISSLDTAKSIFPNADDNTLAKLLKRISALLPDDMNDNDKVENIYTLLSYLNSIIRGDIIDTICTQEREEITGYAKTSLEELLKTIHNETMQAYIADICQAIKDLNDKLNADNTRLQDQNSRLAGEITQKQAQINTLQPQITTLQTQHDELTSQNGELSKEATSLRKEIEDLKAERKRLQDSMKYEVSWEPIPKDHPIYFTTKTSISEFILGLEAEYADKMVVSQSEAAAEFAKYCPTLRAFAHKIEESAYNDAVQEIIEKASYGKTLASMLQGMRLPVYKIRRKTTVADEQLSDKELRAELEQMKATLTTLTGLITQRQKINQQPQQSSNVINVDFGAPRPKR